MAKVIQKAKENNKLKQENLIYEEKYVVDEWDNKGRHKSHEEKTTPITGKNTKVGGMDLNIYDSLDTKYDFSMAQPHDIVTIDNKIYSIVSFSPKPGMIVRETEDNFINRLSGQIYINMADYSIWKITASIPEKFVFRVWFLFIPANIAVKVFNISFEQTEFGGISVEKSIEVTATFETMIKNGTRKYRYDYSNYRFK